MHVWTKLRKLDEAVDKTPTAGEAANETPKYQRNQLSSFSLIAEELLALVPMSVPSGIV